MHTLGMYEHIHTKYEFSNPMARRVVHRRHRTQDEAWRTNQMSQKVIIFHVFHAYRNVCTGQVDTASVWWQFCKSLDRLARLATNVEH